MIVLADTGFHRAKSLPLARTGGDPANVKICRRGQWNVRMIVETTFSMITAVWGSKQMRHITWRGFEAHLSYLMAAFNLLAQWSGVGWNRTKMDASTAPLLTSLSDAN